jgi:hypothetical protein
MGKIGRAFDLTVLSQGCWDNRAVILTALFLITLAALLCCEANSRLSCPNCRRISARFPARTKHKVDAALDKTQKQSSPTTHLPEQATHPQLPYPYQ